MTDVIIQDKDVIVPVEQPTVPPAAVPPKIGLVEINQVVQRGSAWMTGHGAPTLPGGQYGDMYLDVDTGDIYIWDGAAWEYSGTFAPSTLTPEEILAALITVDGPGSNLDADLLDGQHGAYYAKQSDMTTQTTRNDAQDTQLANHELRISGNENSIVDLYDITNDSAADITALQANLAAETTARTNADSAEATTRANADTNLQTQITTEKNRNDAQDTAIAARLTDAPSDVNSYGRKAGAWVDVTEEAPNDGLGYMRKNGAWVPSSGGATTDDLPPAGPLQDGQFWWKSSTGVLYLWYVEPGDPVTAGQWVQVSASPQIVDQNYVRKTANSKNLVVNPCFNVSQENGNTEGTTHGYFAADQFHGVILGTGAAVGIQRVAGQNPSGSQYRFRYRVTTAKASLAAGDIAAIVTRLEGLQIQDLCWSVSGKQRDALLTFGCNFPAGTYSVAVRNNGASLSYTKTFTISAAQAGTDQQITMKIPAATGVWNADNTLGLELYITLASGSTFINFADNMYGPGNFVASPGQSNGLAAVQSFFIWDVGLYADPDKTVLTPKFEVPKIEDDVAQCQRYFQRYINLSIYSGYALAGNGVWQSFILPVSQRVVPTVTLGWRTGSNANAISLYDGDNNHLRIGWMAAAAGASYGFFDANMNARL